MRASSASADQGENDCHGTMGNSALKTGYGCQMPAMVDLWRKTWSAEPGTTDPLAPFGIITLASGGSEGGSDIGGMRWSQTANFGVNPNPAMPASFVAQAYDIGDPYPSKSCYGYSCCWNRYNASLCAKATNGHPELCDPYCTALHDTNFYMGPIHPRLKKPAGQRAAIAAMAIAYPPKGQSAAQAAVSPRKAYTGPTISGCAVSTDGTKLTLKFNTSLLAGGKVEVKPYNKSNTQALRALVNSSLWCMQPGDGCVVDGKFCHEMVEDCVHKVSVCHTQPAAHGKPAHQVCQMQPRCKNATSGVYDVPLVPGCIDFGPPGTLPPPALGDRELDDDPHTSRRALLSAGDGGHGLTGLPYWADTTWISLELESGGGDGDTVVADLSSLNGSAPFAIAYAWDNGKDTCCNAGGDPAIANGFVECTPASCPIQLPDARAPFGALPANPFIARIKDGKCECLEPQVCSEAVV
jgi:hypothetical protein